MNEATIALTVMTGLLLVSFLGFLIWGIRSGQFKNIEDAKYQIFSDRRSKGTTGDSTRENSEAGGDKQQ